MWGERLARAAGWLGTVLLALVFVVVALIYLALQTGPGHDMILRTALSAAEERVNGELKVDRIRSGGLLRGFTLEGVAIRDHEGRPFVEADSVQVGYSVPELLRRRLVLRPVRVWSPRIVLETLHGDALSNAERIFGSPAPEEPDEAEAGEPPAPEEVTPAEEESPILLVFRGVELVNGSLVIRLPLEGDPPERGEVEALPGREGLYRVLRFTGMTGLIQEARILDPEREGEWFLVRSLAMDAHILDEPMLLTDFRGEIRREGGHLEVEAERLWLPGSELSGRFSLDWDDPDQGMVLSTDMTASPARFQDFRWALTELPQGEGRFQVTGEGPLARSRWRVRAADITVGDSRVRGSFGFDLGEPFRLAPTDVELEPLWLRALDPWLEEPLPVQGRLQGRLQAAGTLESLQVAGAITLDDPERGIPGSGMEVDGTLHLGDDPGATDFSLISEELRYATLQAVLPEHPIMGQGSIHARASGRLGRELLVSVQADHSPGDDGPLTRISTEGSLALADGELVLGLSGDLAPLSFDGIQAALNRTFPVQGEVAGSLQLDGPLSDLTIGGELSTPAGPLTGEVRFDVRDPGRSYHVDVAVQDFRLSRFLPDLPDPTTITGSVLVDGRGLDPRELTGEAIVHLTESTVGELQVEETRAHLVADGGRLLVEALDFRSPLLHVTGSGDLGLRDEAPRGEMVLAWEASALENLRPLIGEEDRIDPATLTDLEREALRMEGIDPDTLEALVRLEGSARGELTLRGGIPRIDGEGFAEILEAHYGGTSLGSGRADFLGHWSETEGWEVEAVVDLDRFAHQDYQVEHLAGGFRYAPGRGSAHLELQRDQRESYRLRGDFTHDSLGVEVDLDSLVLAMDDEEWTLQDPAWIQVRGSAVTVEDFSILGPEVGGAPRVRIVAGGTVDTGAESDFRVDLEGVDLDRVARMIGLRNFPSGVLALELDFQGETENPRMDGSFRVGDFTFNGATLDRVEGNLTHRDRLLEGTLEAGHEGEVLFTGRGSLPLDIGFRTVEDRLPDGELDIALTVNGFPAAAALAFLEVLESVEGTLDGEVRVGGTAREPRPTGELRVTNGALAIPDIGFRTSQIQAELNLREDRTVEVTAQARSRGTARIRGALDLDEPTDPGFDLRIDMSGFQAVERRDLNVRLGGFTTLNGRYRAPRLGGEVRVEQGVLFLDEFARAAEVVDITDPAFRDVVDTTLVAGRDPSDMAENPFLENLLVEVDLTVQRDSWIRSREMNVEIAGDLIVTFDRRRRDLLLVGTLEAIRGTYVAFGRTFQVAEGTVDFPGTPGINPALNIQAVNRVRQRDSPGETVNVIASLEGSLERPRVSLTSDAEPPIPESDLISYLLFGRPSDGLAAGERSVLEGAAMDLGVGHVATQLGGVLARQIGVDYFAVTQAQPGPGMDGRGEWGTAFAHTQIEMGQYVGQDLFLAIMLRPLTGLGASYQSQIPGARIEWRFSDHWTTEAFVEDRFARQGAPGLGDVGVRLSKVWGLALYREWTY